MSILNAFLSTWSHTRRTFGTGAPAGGAQYDGSDLLNSAETVLASATPGEHWSGSAATEYDVANTKHHRIIGQFAAVDHRLRSEVDRSADVTDIGRRNLDTVRKQVIDAVATTPQGQAGERLKLAIAQRGLEQLREIVQRSIAESRDIAGRIRGLGDEYTALDIQETLEDQSAIRAVDFKTDTPDDPPPLMPGQPIDPANPFIGDQRFGHWENVIPLPYTGTTPPPPTQQYHPFPEGTPLKVGGTTGWYTPGRNWAADPPLVRLEEQYRFRLAGREATTYTRMVHENGRWQQQRWIQNVYEYQRHTQITFGGDVHHRRESDLAALSTPFLDFEWKPIGLNEIASLSAKNAAVTYYLPDGCGGQFTYQGGVPMGGQSGLPPSPPIMTRPR
ncbi:EspA/EspE family type VII secretion system effector [Mycobacterium barrassiae]|uniref:EspA/EspE family type VII secretion system effector n=1 Tax=Mycobacterium barrassiae TaxID=319709 RepID=UPI0022659CCF|nr:EspA/EspE family type VII secretion system effector [Mycobacterium barrassiae]